MRKEIREVVNGLREIADPPESFKVWRNGHYQVSLEVKDLNGNQTILRFPMPFSPSDYKWRLAFRTQLRHKILEQNANAALILEGTIFQ